jgi:hypothetical protein
MPAIVLCKICQKRRAKRFCPAVQGDICALCCGTEREVSLSCPLECEYLRAAHRHEKSLPVAEQAMSDPDIQITEGFLHDQEELLLFCVYALVQAAVRSSGATDADILVSWEALIKTHRTLESGLFYETRPENSVAAGVQRSFAASLEEYQKLRQEREGLAPVRNGDILKVLVFLHRLGQQNQNGRPRGRMYLDLLRQMTPDGSLQVSERAPSIII